jgi:8-oxo-dGTP pyrophosphatase MutT (NUDIX family)
METDFKEMFFYLEAAGGVVLNRHNQVLFIYRSGIWDLPKGKIDGGEGIENCALREVEEETGVKGLHISESLKSSYHIYPHKKKWYLKKTYWFFMETSFDDDLKPQLEEEITEARWMNLDECRQALKETYRSLRESIGDEICLHLVKAK